MRAAILQKSRVARLPAGTSAFKHLSSASQRTRDLRGRQRRQRRVRRQDVVHGPRRKPARRGALEDLSIPVRELPALELRQRRKNLARLLPCGVPGACRSAVLGHLLAAPKGSGAPLALRRIARQRLDWLTLGGTMAASQMGARARRPALIEAVVRSRPLQREGIVNG